MTTPTPNAVTVVSDEKTVALPTPIALAGGGTAVVASTATPTQVANPRRTTFRSIVQLLLALLTAVPQIVPIITGAWSPEWLVTAGAQVLLVQSVIVRLMALPGVESWLQENVPWLAALRTTTAALPQ